jgi:outer membrane protein OmpA-like peptidoglycan-associated protein
MTTRIRRSWSGNIFAGYLLLMVVLSQQSLSQGTGSPSPGGIKEDSKVDRSTVQTDIRTLVSSVENLSGNIQDLQVKETDLEIRIDLAADVLFDFDKSDIKPQAQPLLKKAAEYIRDKGKGSIRIEGYTDAKGSDSYNQKLSERRATSVKNWFIKKEGLRDFKFSTEGFGAKKPVAPNTKPDGSDDPEGRQKNRRVEIIIKK